MQKRRLFQELWKHFILQQVQRRGVVQLSMWALFATAFGKVGQATKTVGRVGRFAKEGALAERVLATFGKTEAIAE